MYKVQQITQDTKQQQTLVLPDGTGILLVLRYVPLQYGWFIDTLSYNNFTLNNLRITNQPNMLLPFRNQIPFGLACVSIGPREPTQQQDFFSGFSTLYVLNSDEVEQYVAFLSSPVTE